MFESKIVVEFDGKRLSGKTNKTAASPSSEKKPLVIAIHGGSYSSAYFDIPGYSLLDKADANGIAAISLDRPSYGQSTPLPDDDATIARNAEVLNQAIGKIYEARKNFVSGIFVIGHSIGGATVVTLASLQPSWPLSGIAVSGVGLVTPPGDAERWAGLPPGLVSLPTEIKDFVMFGPEGTYGSDMPKASHAANTTCPRAELIDITANWFKVVKSIAAKVKVPVHYRQAEFDHLWIVSEDEVKGFGAAFTSSPKVDARLFKKAGHCIDFHLVAGEFHQEQLDFAKQNTK